MVAIYAGDASFNSSSTDGRIDPLELSLAQQPYTTTTSTSIATTTPTTTTATRSNTQTTISSSLNPSLFCQSVTFIPKVTPSFSQGIVKFFDGATELGSAILNSSATATFTTSLLTSSSLFTRFIANRIFYRLIKSVS